MNCENIQKDLKVLREALKERETYLHACRIIEFDKQTVCPSMALQRQGEAAAFLSNRAFRISKSVKFISALERLFGKRNYLDEWDKVLVENLYREHLRTKNVTPKMDKEFSLVFNRAFVDWLSAKERSDYSLFAPSLSEVRRVSLKQIALAEKKSKVPYDNLLDVYERGMTAKDLNRIFESCKECLVPMLRKILKSKKKIRTDFLSRPVTDESQRKMADYLLKLIGFDFSRGTFSTSEHPFTEGLAEDDVRVTTHYDRKQFTSSMYSIIHEGGHALFEQNQPMENFEHFVQYGKTLGQHESVSRFYENRIGRSRAFIHLIFKKAKEIFPTVFVDVTEKQFYEAVNLVTPSFVRTEADEFTYTFHIIIRFEMEQLILNEKVDVADLPRIWNDKYEEYLGIRPSKDSEGILQDVHWTSGFGYFPTYALGNFYNAMYYNRMQEDLNIDEAVSDGKICLINDWMKEHVWKFADRLDAKTWIRKITGREFTERDFLDYLERKYGSLYGV